MTVTVNHLLRDALQALEQCKRGSLEDRLQHAVGLPLRDRVRVLVQAAGGDVIEALRRVNLEIAPGA